MWVLFINNLFILFLSYSQSLINLMLTGRAVSHVFDDEKEVAGLSKLCYLFNAR